MALHVDIVVNDLTRRLHRCVAALHLVDNDNTIKVEVIDESYRGRIPISVWDPTVRGDVTRQSNPRRYLELLQHELSGIHLFATAPHEAEHCMFRSEHVVSMATDAEHRLSV